MKEQEMVSVEPAVIQPEVVDDFLRNFFVRNGMQETLQVFEQEWYLLCEQGVVTKERLQIHEQHQLNAQLEAQISALKKQNEELQASLKQTKEALVKTGKERDVHRMHHKRLTQEKAKLTEDLKRVKLECTRYEPLIEELKKKYESEIKKTTMVTLERDKLQKKLEAFAQPLPELIRPASPPKHKTVPPKKAAWCSSAQKKNMEYTEEIEALQVTKFGLSKTCKGHSMPISHISIHPSKPVIATSSDDRTWKMWRLPEGEFMMSGEGHEDWISGSDFHPLGNHLVTGSGDGTVKIWNFQEQKSVKTFSDHHAVWSVKYHPMGDLVASGSHDNVARLWDLHTERCRLVFRGHADSVNTVDWQPRSNSLCTASSDKTISLWCAKNGLCNATFYGHTNSVNHCTFNSGGQTLASCDADGMVRLWDIRMIKELFTIQNPAPANCCTFDSNGKILLVAFEDGIVRAFDAVTSEIIHSMVGHEGSVQSVVCDQGNQFVVTAGADLDIKYWSLEQNTNKNR